jgi:hypothetical protein
MMFKTIAVTTAITLSAVSVQAKDYLDGVYTGGPGPSDSIGKRMKKKPHSAWVWEDTGCGNNCSQPNAPKSGVAGFSFSLLTIWQNPGSGFNTVKSEPFGVYASMQECDMARARKIAQLDANNLRQPHILPGTSFVPTTTSQSTWGYTSGGATSSGGGGAREAWNYSGGSGSGYGESGWGYSSFGPTARGGGQSSSTTSHTQMGPTENMSVTFCEPGVYAPSNPVIKP